MGEQGTRPQIPLALQMLEIYDLIVRTRRSDLRVLCSRLPRCHLGHRLRTSSLRLWSQKRGGVNRITLNLLGLVEWIVSVPRHWP